MNPPEDMLAHVHQQLAELDQKHWVPDAEMRWKSTIWFYSTAAANGMGYGLHQCFTYQYEIPHWQQVIAQFLWNEYTRDIPPSLAPVWFQSSHAVTRHAMKFMVHMTGVLRNPILLDRLQQEKSK